MRFYLQVVKQLLQNDAVVSSLTSPSTDPRYKSPLHLAAKGGHDDIVQLLLQAGVNVNECRAEGTALHLASLYGKINVVKLLIQVRLFKFTTISPVITAITYIITTITLFKYYYYYYFAHYYTRYSYYYANFF